MVVIKQISANDTYVVRHRVLRQGKPLKSCAFANDNDASTIHFGLYENGQLAAVASLFAQSNDLFKGKQYQLRGMAVLEEFRRKGFGEALLNKVEEYSLSNSIQVLWFNARESAVHFYSASNYEIFGNSFVIEGIGTHYIMYKFIQ